MYIGSIKIGILEPPNSSKQKGFSKCRFNILSSEPLDNIQFMKVVSKIM